jgi:hypothetical protein
MQNTDLPVGDQDRIMEKASASKPRRGQSSRCRDIVEDTLIGVNRIPLRVNHQ